MLANWFNQFGGSIEAGAYDYANGGGTGGVAGRPPGASMDLGTIGDYHPPNYDQAVEYFKKNYPQYLPGAGPYDPSGGTGPRPGGTLAGGAAAFGQAWLASGGRTVQDLQNFVAQHPEYGAQLVGSKHDKVTIGNQTFDAVIGAGAGGLGGSWNDVTAGGSAPATSGGTLGSLGFGSLAQGPQLSVDQLRNTPGYQFAFDQGQQAIQRSAAAHGTLLDAGLQKALARYGTGIADQTYGQAFDRARNVQNDVFNRYYSLGNWGQANPGA